MFLRQIFLIFFILISFGILAHENEIVPGYKIKLIITLIFLLCYILVILEEFIHIKKSEITIFFSSLMLIILILSKNSSFFYINSILNHFLHTYCELFLFLFVAMVYINSLKNLHFFDVITTKIILKKFSLKKIYFITGLSSFFISPLADNLTTALIMSSIILHIKNVDSSFVNLSCINIVIASNSGGAFSPFGDITTLMIWQSGVIKFAIFFKLFFPSLISFLIPSIIMSFYIKNRAIEPVMSASCDLKVSLDVKIILVLFLFTISSAVFFQSYLNVSSVFGMMFGFSFLQIFFLIKNKPEFNLSNQIVNIEWETLLFFYGIMLCVISLDLVGLLKDLSYFLYCYSDNKTLANIFLGLLSAIIDNIPITFLVLNMKINMCDGQWLLLTYTVAAGGSILSIGSAAGIAVMGKAKKQYTFYSHFKWSWVILIGYFSGAVSHIILNKQTFI